MKLVFVFAVWLIKVLFLNFFEVLKIIGAFLVDAFVNGKMLAVFFWEQEYDCSKDSEESAVL